MDCRRNIVILLTMMCSYTLYGQQGLSKRPNVLFIMVDDLRPDLGCYGKANISSPNIDRLAKRGQLFTHAYSNIASCGPSRASLLSGLYPSQTRFQGWNTAQDEDAPGIESLPMYLRNQDYHTISLGKVYNNFDDGKGSWDEVWVPPYSTTTWWDYQTKDGIALFEARNSERELDTSRRSNSNLPLKGVAFERADVADNVYRDGRIADRAVEELQGFVHSSSPFFMAVGFYKPHLPFNAPQKYWDIYDNDPVELPGSTVPPKNVPQIALHNFGELRGFSGMPTRGAVSDELASTLVQGYYACVSYLDAQIGKVLNSLEELGLSENTIIVLWSDHGLSLGEQGIWAKGGNFQSTSHIPLIVRVPGKRGGVQIDGLVESVDIYPTLIELLDLDSPSHLQGESFASMLDNPNERGKTTVFFRSDGRLGRETIITDDYSYTEFFDENWEVQASMLYNLKDDPQETVNIVADERNKSVVEQLSRKLRQHISNR